MYYGYPTPIQRMAWFAILIVGLIGWYISFKMFVNASCEAAASVKWAGLWPKVEE